MRTIRMISGAMALVLMAAPVAAQLPRPSPLPPPSKPKAPPPAPKVAPQAQPKITPPAPYTVLKVSPPKPYEDASLAAFRKSLAAAAQKKDRAALAKLVLAQGFFWLKDDNNAAGKKSGLEVMATALNLGRDGSGWDSLSEYANDETAAPYPDRPDTVCSPAGPDFNPPDLEKLAEKTKTEIGDWGFFTQEGIEVHASAQPDSPVIDKLGMHFIRVMPDTAPNASQEMMRIVTPGGKVGFVAAEAISPLGSDQLCFGKEANGVWKVVGMIGFE